MNGVNLFSENRHGIGGNQNNFMPNGGPFNMGGLSSGNDNMSGQQRNNNGQNSNHFSSQHGGIYVNDILCWLSNYHNRYNSNTLCRQIMETYSSNDILQACTTLKDLATNNNNSFNDSSVFFNDQMSLEEKTVRCMLYIFKLNKTERNVLPRFVSQGLHLPKLQNYTHMQLQEPLQDLKDYMTEQVMMLRAEITTLKRLFTVKSTEENNSLNKITEKLFSAGKYKNFNTNNFSSANNQPGSKLNSIRDQLILKQAMNQKQQLQNHLKTNNILNFGATTPTSNYGLNLATSSAMDSTLNLGNLFSRSINNSATFQLSTENSDSNNQNNGTENEENKNEINAVEINQTVSFF